jgi:hypothetical protein
VVPSGAVLTACACVAMGSQTVQNWAFSWAMILLNKHGAIWAETRAHLHNSDWFLSVPRLTFVIKENKKSVNQGAQGTKHGKYKTEGDIL